MPIISILVSFVVTVTPSIDESNVEHAANDIAVQIERAGLYARMLAIILVYGNTTRERYTLITLQLSLSSDIYSVVSSLDISTAIMLLLLALRPTTIGIRSIFGMCVQLYVPQAVTLGV